MKIIGFYKLLIIGLLCLPGLKSSGQQQDMAFIEGGTYKPFVKGDKEEVPVNAFWMDKKAVTNTDYQRFVEANPQWSKENAKRIFADSNYLYHWPDSGLSQHSGPPDGAPVVNVSWFAAKAYCEWQNKRLPKLHEWEFVARAFPKNDVSADSLQRIISDWYSNRLKHDFLVGSVYQNTYGVWDMHGLVWEWVYDFNSIVMNNDGRNQEEMPEGLFCGSASLNANDATDYAAFVRFAFRTSLKGNYNLRKLGFRCAK